MKNNFENSMKRLDEIVMILEKGDMDIDEMVSLYHEGMTLVTECDKKLLEINTKINEIAQNNEAKSE